MIQENLLLRRKQPKWIVDSTTSRVEFPIDDEVTDDYGPLISRGYLQSDVQWEITPVESTGYPEIYLVYTKYIPIEFQANGWTMLHDATMIGSEEMFKRGVQLINWDLEPEVNIIEGIELAMRTGAHLTSRELAQKGAQLYPDNLELRKYAKILAPARILKILPRDQFAKNNSQWLIDNSNLYRGKWVGLLDGKLVGVGVSKKEIHSLDGITADVLVTLVS